MQRVSWEEETRLINGTCFDIDFSRDFSTIFLDGIAIENIPVCEIVKYLIPQDRDGACDDNRNVFSSEDYWQKERIFKAADKFAKEEEKMRKWEEDRNRNNNKKRVKRAEQKLDYALWKLSRKEEF